MIRFEKALRTLLFSIIHHLASVGITLSSILGRWQWSHPKSSVVIFHGPTDSVGALSIKLKLLKRQPPSLGT